MFCSSHNTQHCRPVYVHTTFTSPLLTAWLVLHSWSVSSRYRGLWFDSRFVIIKESVVTEMTRCSRCVPHQRPQQQLHLQRQIQTQLHVTQMSRRCRSGSGQLLLPLGPCVCFLNTAVSRHLLGVQTSLRQHNLQGAGSERRVQERPVPEGSATSPAPNRRLQMRTVKNSDCSGFTRFPSAALSAP